MRRLILLISLLLLSTVWIVAQSQSNDSDTGTGSSAVGSDSQSSSGNDINQQNNGMGPQSGEENNVGTSGSQGSSEMNAPANEPSSSEEGMTQNESSGGGKTVTGNESSQGTGTSSNEASGEQSSSSMHHGSMPKERTVSGCLSEENGQYMLTDKSGSTFQLTGKTSQLKAHVGHEIRVRGRESTMGESASSRSSEPGSMSGGQGAEQSLSVISLKQISSTCNTANTPR